jgi:hypothetical protein
MKIKSVIKRILCLAVSLILLQPWLVGASQASPASSLCAPLPAPTGAVIEVSSVTSLVNAVNSAVAGTTILVDNGNYALNGAYLRFAAPDVALRSKSGNREAVILDGGYQTDEIVQIVASGVTIADLTLKRAAHHPIHVAVENSDILNTLIYNMHVIDPGQQAIKINQNSAYTHFADYGEVACSRIELTDTGRPYVWSINGSCYTGGIDGHQARGWVIRDNSIEGFWCQNGLSEHAIHFWTGSRDTLVERNFLKDDARGIGLGLGESGSNWRTYVDDPCPGVNNAGHYAGIVRNNMIFASRSALFSSQNGFDCGICLEQACKTSVVQNTVVSTQNPFSSIEWRFSLTSVNLYNNLASYILRQRDNATAVQAGNLENAPLSLFVNGAAGDLHLASSASQAIDKGISLAAGLCEDDFDGDLRPIGPAWDIGADEYGIPAPAAVTDLRLTNVTLFAGSLTGRLRWTAPAGAMVADLRYAYQPIDESVWAGASLITNTISAASGVYTTTVPFSTGETLLFALKVQGAGGWSPLSNNAFWPQIETYLPVVRK